jgi:hypothetical protein
MHVRVYDSLDQGGRYGSVDSVAAAIEDAGSSGSREIVFC